MVEPATTPPPAESWWIPARRLAGRAYRTVRRLVSRTLHPLRRRAAQAQLTRLGPQRGVLVICFGNICRSPYAAAVLSQRLPAAPGLQVSQGGFFGPNRPSPDNARTAAATRGIDLSGHRSQLLTPGIVRAATLVLVMESSQARRIREEFGVVPDRVLHLGDLDPEAITTRDIQDPYGMSLEVFGRTYARIDRCIGSLAELLPRG